MKNLFFINYLMMAMAFAFTGCRENEDVDVQPPAIDLIEPHGGDEFSAGEHFHYEIKFTDDVALKIFEIEIHENFDAHQHEPEARLSNGLEKFSYKESFEISGKTLMIDASNEEDYELHINDNSLAGPYHFIVKAIDAAGNATRFEDGSNAEVEILITNDHQATVTINSMVTNPGEPFEVDGLIEDPNGNIEEIYLQVGKVHDDEDDDHDHARKLSGNDENHIIEVRFVDQQHHDGGDDHENEYLMELGNKVHIQQLIDTMGGYTFPADMDQDLMLTLEVHDVQGNITINKEEFHVNP